jgi:4'-phosphopantetheinyl transferase
MQGAMTRHPTLWEPPDCLAAPSDGDIHVVKLSLADSQGDELRAFLSHDERERANNFRFDRDRDRYIAARAGLRQILGTCLNTDPRELVFEYGAQGKPALAGSEFSLRFNLSHSGEMAIYALADGRDIGVDIERLDTRRDHDGIADRFFSAGESEALSMIPEKVRAHAFTQLWVRKEAFLKARGQGLFMSLDEVEISVGHEAPRIIAVSGESAGCASWFIADIEADPNYAAAVVALGPEVAIRGYTWNVDL